jgi:hypothetical protein
LLWIPENVMSILTREEQGDAVQDSSVASFDPQQLAVLYRAFDDVWAELEPDTAEGLYEAMRNAIASALIQAAMNGERDEDASARVHEPGLAPSPAYTGWPIRLRARPPIANLLLA